VLLALALSSGARAQERPEGEEAVWQGRHTLFAGASLLYALGAWPGAVLFGSDATREAPGVAVALGGRFGLVPELELVVDVGARFFFFGDLARDAAPGAPQASEVRILEPTLGASLRIRPGAGRFHIDTGFGLGWAFLQGIAEDPSGPLEPTASRNGFTAELRGGVGVLFGPARTWDVSVRLRIAGYPAIEDVSTLATLLEIEITGPLLSRP
jgi:hypothetical protein